MKEHTNHLVSIIPALNLDVVTQIMEYSKCGTISETMKACRAYYLIGVPILLRRPVKIPSSRFLSSFYDFIFATNLGPADRARFLRTIIWDHDVDIPRDPNNGYKRDMSPPFPYSRERYEQDRDDALKFMRILSQASGLEYLDFTRGSSEQFIEYCPDAVDTFVNLVRLRSLHICHGTTTDVNWFLRAKSPIAALAIDLRRNELDTQLSTFSRFRDTLVSFEIWNFVLEPGDENLQFPHVRRFRIEGNYGQCPIPASYVFQIFPNIQVLELPSHFVEATYGDYNESDIQNQRRLNSAQVRKLEPAQRNFHLKELRGCAADLFRGAYECTVENLSVVRLDCWDFQWFLPLLPQMRPVSLLLQFDVCTNEPGPIQIVAMALQKVSTLKNLSLFIEIPNPQDASESSIHWSKEDFYTAFTHASIETLTIVCGRADQFELWPIDYWKTGRVVESVVCKIVEVSKTLRTAIVGDWSGTHTFNISHEFVPSYYEISMTDQSRVWFHYSFSHRPLKWPVSDGYDIIGYDIDV